MFVRYAVLIVACAACGGSSAAAPSAASPAGASGANPAQSAPETPAQASTSGGVQIAPEILTACGIPGDQAFFRFDSSRLEKRDIKPLNDVAVCFTSGALKGRAIKLVGHADPRGSAGYNMTLGQARADSVQKYLVDKGMTESNVTSTSRGAMDATGTDESGWAHDRRVDVMLGG